MEISTRCFLVAVVLALVGASPLTADAQAPTPGARASAPQGTTKAPSSAVSTSKPPSATADAPKPSSATPTAPKPPLPAASAPRAGPALEPQGYTYSPDGRRDPFVSWLQRGAESQPTLGGRPAGLAGLETAEVTLRGTLASQGDFVAILQGADNRTYVVKPGDRLLDGTIRTIAQDSMVISQQVHDPLSLEKQREVRKVLRQTEEAK